MKKTLTLSLFLLANICFLQAQEFELSGKVVNQDSSPLSFATVLLYKNSDTTQVKGVSADEEGDFLFKGVPAGLYLLRASYVSRLSNYVLLDVQQDVKIGAIVMPEEVNELGEVVVAAKKPVLKRQADRLVFQVENTVVTQGNSLDILKSTPGLITNPNGFNIRGQGATVYINNRRVRLSSDEINQLLEGLPGNTVQSVELIHNPPAQYDADGGPILNIVTSKNVSLGYKGSLNAAYTQGILAKYQFGMSHYWQNENSNLFLNYNFSPSNRRIQVDKGINFINPQGDVFSRWLTDEEDDRKQKMHSVNFAYDLKLGEKDAISLTANAFVNPDVEWRRRMDATLSNGSGVLDSTFNTANTGTENAENIAADLVWKHSTDNGSLSLGGHYTRFQEDQNQTIFTRYFNPAGQTLNTFGFDTRADQQIDIATAQLDYSYQKGVSSWEMGAKYSYIASDNEIDYLNFIGGTNDAVNAGLSDEYRYEEEVLAAYLSWSADWEKFSAKAGLRGEQTNALGDSRILNEVNELDFFRLFPTLYMLWTVDESNSFAFDYGRRVDRPQYNDLNPFRYFYNENDFEEGNPRLQPVFSHNFNLNYTLNGEYFIDLYYRDNGQYISYLVFQDNDNLTLRELKQNIQASRSYGIDFTVSKSIASFWDFLAYSSLFHEEEVFLAEESGGVEVTNSFDGFYIYLANYLNLSADGSWTAEATAEYMSGNIFGSYVREATTNVTLGLRKSLWNDRAVLSVRAEDLLGQAMGRYTSRYLNQNNNFFTQPETQFVRFGFTYNFGNFRLTDNERRIEKDERERLGEN